MARAKTASDERYNARRRARRELARIERSIESGKLSQAQEATQRTYARRLRESIEASYVQRRIRPGMKPSERRRIVSGAEQALKASEKAIESRRKSATATARQNRVFETRLKAAQQGAPSGVGGLDAVRAQFFYVATKRLWQGFPLADRNRAIMRGLGVESLEEAYRIVTRANRAQIAAYREMLRGIRPDVSVSGWTDQAREFYEDAPLMEEDFRIASPVDVFFF